MLADIFGCQDSGWKVPPASNKKRPGKMLNAPQCPGQPPLQERTTGCTSPGVLMLPDHGPAPQEDLNGTIPKLLFPWWMVRLTQLRANVIVLICLPKLSKYVTRNNESFTVKIRMVATVWKISLLIWGDEPVVSRNSKLVWREYLQSTH